MHILSKIYKFKFKIPYLIIIINQIICSCLIYFSSEILFTNCIVVCLAVLSYAGHIILFPNLIHTINIMIQFLIIKIFYLCLILCPNNRYNL